MGRKTQLNQTSHPSFLAGSVRLSDGGSFYGRLEIKVNNEWGTVCRSGWGGSDTKVTCRMMGYQTGKTVSNKAFDDYNIGHAPASGRIWVSGVECEGDEHNLSDCGNPGWGAIGACSHEDDVGLLCFNEGNCKYSNVYVI